MKQGRQRQFTWFSPAYSCLSSFSRNPGGIRRTDRDMRVLLVSVEKKNSYGMHRGFLALFAVVMAPPHIGVRFVRLRKRGPAKVRAQRDLYLGNRVAHVPRSSHHGSWAKAISRMYLKSMNSRVTGSDEPFHGRSGSRKAGTFNIYHPPFGTWNHRERYYSSGMSYTSIKDLNYIKKVTQVHVTKKQKSKEVKQYNLALALEGSLIAYLVSGRIHLDSVLPELLDINGFHIVF